MAGAGPGHVRRRLDSQGGHAADLDIMQKPFTEAVLLARVGGALDKAAAQRAALA
jgi:hypothetical protein